MANNALHLTAISLRSIAAGELCRWAEQVATTWLYSSIPHNTGKNQIRHPRIDGGFLFRLDTFWGRLLERGFRQLGGYRS